MNSKSIKIVIADDHEVVRDGVKALLEKQPSFAVIAGASNGNEALEKTLQLKPDVLLMDISMPGLNGIDTVKAIRAQSPEQRVVILSMHSDVDHISSCLELNVNGYVVKTQGGKEIIGAIETVCQGKNFYSNAVTTAILEKYYDQHRSQLTKKKQQVAELTAREKEVIVLIAQGLTNQKIGDKLFLSFRTVETHRANLMRKLEAKNSIELINKARASSLIE